jgi:hypothetical protein
MQIEQKHGSSGFRARKMVKPVFVSNGDLEMQTSRLKSFLHPPSILCP